MLRTSWIEIPVHDLERAMVFYQRVLNLVPTPVIEGDGRRITVLPSVDGTAGVSLNQTANFVPSDQGVLVYFHLDTDLQQILDRVELAGGTIIDPKHLRSIGGYFAIVKDSEGNLFALNAAA
jgi:hypothetical protein